MSYYLDNFAIILEFPFDHPSIVLVEIWTSLYALRRACTPPIWSSHFHSISFLLLHHQLILCFIRFLIPLPLPPPHLYFYYCSYSLLFYWTIILLLFNIFLRLLAYYLLPQILNHFVWITTSILNTWISNLHAPPKWTFCKRFSYCSLGFTTPCFIMF